jgi:hypothetical protein
MRDTQQVRGDHRQAQEGMSKSRSLVVWQRPDQVRMVACLGVDCARRARLAVAFTEAPVARKSVILAPIRRPREES